MTNLRTWITALILLLCASQARAQIIQFDDGFPTVGTLKATIAVKGTIMTGLGNPGQVTIQGNRDGNFEEKAKQYNVVAVVGKVNTWSFGPVDYPVSQSAQVYYVTAAVTITLAGNKVGTAKTIRTTPSR